MKMLAIVCPLVFLGGLVDAVAGGGGLITLPAYLLAGVPAHMAAATNKCGNVFGTLLATGRFVKHRNVHFPSAVIGALSALVGAWIGAKINLVVPEQTLYFVMLAVVPLMAIFLVIKRDLGQKNRSYELSQTQLMATTLGIGLVIGGYDGFFGPGTGTFLMLAFTELCRFDLLTASGNTKVVNSAASLAALATFSIAGKVIWSLGIPAALCGLAGNYVGTSLALKSGAKIIRPMFFIVLGLLLIRLVYGLLV